MKKSICLILLGILLQHFELKAQRFRAGLTAGLVASDINGADTHDYDNDFLKAGVVIGGLVNYPFDKKSSLELELNYIQKGTSQPADSNGNGSLKFSFNYLEFPLIYKRRLYVNREKKFIGKFDVYAGISAGKMISSELMIDGFEASAVNSLNKTDVSLLAGIDYYFSERFSFSFRYSNSIIPVIRRNSVPFAFFGQSFNKGNSLVLHFMFQYMFGNVPGSRTPGTEEAQ